MVLAGTAATAALARIRVLAWRRVIITSWLVEKSMLERRSSAGHHTEDRTPHKRLEKRQLVAVLGKRRGAVQGSLPRLPCHVFVNAPARQGCLGCPGAVGHRRRRAEDDCGALATRVSVEIENDRHVGKRPIEGALFALLQMSHPQAR